MKFIRIISVFLLVCLLACSFISCGKSNKNNETPTNEADTTPPPQGTKTEGLVEMKVSFVINDGTTNIYNETNYTYKSFGSSILDVIEYYVTVQQGKYFEKDEYDLGTIVCIGEYIAEEGKEWVALRGTQFKDKSGNDIKLSQLVKPENQEYMLSEYEIGASSLAEYELTDGDSFTLVLVNRGE